MCYAIPGKIKTISGNKAVLDYYGEERQALVEIAVQPGDYVYAQGGYVLQKVPEHEALPILESWRELFFELQALDQELATPNLRLKDPLLDKILKGYRPDHSEIKELMNSARDLGAVANFWRNKNLGNSCCVHGIIEMSNICKRNCAYCGLTADIFRYKMTKTQVIAAVAEAVEKYGFKAIVLQSGEGAYFIAELEELISEIQKRFQILIFISFGELKEDELQRLYKAGARGLLLRFETSNPELYRKYHGGELASRLDIIKKAAALGYLVITGSLIGLPEQNEDDLIKDIDLAASLPAEMLSFGPVIPHPGTKCAELKPLAPEKVVRFLAAVRLSAPKDTKIVVTTALETLSLSARREALMAGANSVMLNATPLEYRSLYNIYPKRAHETETLQDQIYDTIALLKSLGRAPTDLGT